MQKIDQDKVKRWGRSKRFYLNLPKIFAMDNHIETDDIVNFYRTQVDGKDALVLIPKSIDEPSESQNKVA